MLTWSPGSGVVGVEGSVVVGGSGWSAPAASRPAVDSASSLGRELDSGTSLGGASLVDAGSLPDSETLLDPETLAVPEALPGGVASGPGPVGRGGGKLGAALPVWRSRALRSLANALVTADFGSSDCDIGDHPTFPFPHVPQRQQPTPERRRTPRARSTWAAKRRTASFTLANSCVEHHFGRPRPAGVTTGVSVDPGTRCHDRAGTGGVAVADAATSMLTRRPRCRCVGADTGPVGA